MLKISVLKIDKNVLKSPKKFINLSFQIQIYKYEPCKYNFEDVNN